MGARAPRSHPALHGPGRRERRRVLAAVAILAALCGLSVAFRHARRSDALGSEAPRPAAPDPVKDTVIGLATRAVDAPSLLALADAKRLSGDLDQAKRAYVALRSRFQTSVEAGNATFWLGEMEFSNQKDYANASLWFDAYLREQPRGAFAVQAQQRLIESLYRIGDWGGALRTANEYVAAHPNAPDSSAAWAILHDDYPPE